MKNTRVQFWDTMTGFSAKIGKKEIAWISEHGSVIWRMTDEEIEKKLSIDNIVAVQMFSAGVAYYQSTGIKEARA